MTAPAQVPVELGRAAAREAAREELSKPEYAVDRPSLFEQLLDALGRFLDQLIDSAAGASPGGLPGLVLITLSLAGLVLALRMAIGPLVGTSRAEAAALHSTRTAADHRHAADQCAAGGDWAGAVRERMRAIVRELEDSGVIDARPGRTAQEAATAAGAAVPQVGLPAARAASLFAEIWYGSRTATTETDAEMRRLDDEVRLAAQRPEVSA